MTSNAIPTLFEDDLPGEAGGESLYSGLSSPGFHFALSHTGRRVTGTVRILIGPQTLNGCNPFGTRECRVDFTAPQSRDWSDDHIAQWIRESPEWKNHVARQLAAEDRAQAEARGKRQQ